MIINIDVMSIKSYTNIADSRIPLILKDNFTSTAVMDFQTGCIHTATLAVSTLLVIFVLFLGCTGNGIVLFNALTARQHRTNFELLVINLAGADFIMCTCLSPMFLFLLFSDSDIPLVFCGSILFLGVLSALLSLLSIVTIAVHRCCQIVGSLHRPLSLRRMSALVVGIWILSSLIALAGTFHVTLSWGQEPINECQNVVNTNKKILNNFVLYFISPVTVISLLTITASYGIIASAARKATRRGVGVVPFTSAACHHETTCDDSATDKAGDGTMTVEKCVPSGIDLKSDNGQKATTLCFVVTLTVILCWGPLVMSQFVQLFTGDSIILYQVKLCGIALIFLNSALNPYLYGQSNSKVKYKYIRVLYKFAKCDYAFPFAKTPKRCERRDTYENCPLHPSLDRLSRQLSLDECDSLSHTVDMPCARQYITNIQYAHSLLLVSRQDGPVVTAMAVLPKPTHE